MNFNESVSYLYSLGNEVLAMKFGLETIRTLADALDNPQQKSPAVHIAGTNGKGSTAAMTDAILRAAGYHTGLYTSPNLISITERFSVDGHEIKESDFARLATTVRTAGDQLVADGLLGTPPTFFEQITMIAYLHFAECNVDIAVLEVGMGGRLDATNICQSVVTAITPVGFDHQQYLGNTLAEISSEKAGIIKPGIPAIIAPQDDEAMQTIAARAAYLNAPLIPVSDEFIAEPGTEFGRYRLRFRQHDALLALRGRHQATNAMTAIYIADQLNQSGWKIERPAIEAGLSNTVWPCRLQLIQSPNTFTPSLLLDGAHNVAGARVLREFLDDHCRHVPITMIFGVMQDKAPLEMARILFPAAGKVILTKANSPRAAQPQALARELAPLHTDLICAASLPEALAEASRDSMPNQLILICGSLYLAGEALAFTNK